MNESENLAVFKVFPVLFLFFIQDITSWEMPDDIKINMGDGRKEMRTINKVSQMLAMFLWQSLCKQLTLKSKNNIMCAFFSVNSLDCKSFLLFRFASDQNDGNPYLFPFLHALFECGSEST